MILSPVAGKDIIKIFKDHIKETQSDASKEYISYSLREFIRCFMKQTMDMLCREEYSTLSKADIETYKQEIVFLIECYEIAIKE